MQCSFIFCADRWGFLLLHKASQINNQVDTELLILCVFFGPCKCKVCPNIVRGHWEGLHGGCTEGGGFLAAVAVGAVAAVVVVVFFGGMVESSLSGSALGNVGGVSSSSSTSSKYLTKRYLFSYWKKVDVS